MHDHHGRWERRATLNPRTSLEQQVVFGHLLPHLQAAQDWQELVRALRCAQDAVAGADQRGKHGVVGALREAILCWRGRQGICARGWRGAPVTEPNTIEAE